MHDDLSLLDLGNTLKALSFGELGEMLAARFLERLSYRLVAANFKVPVGRNSKGVQVTGEIDLIALDRETLVFVEVKARHSDDFTPIITNIDRRKQRQIIRTARVYRRIFGLHEMKYRYDAVTVLDREGQRPKIDHFPDLWNESAFRKQYRDNEYWHDLV